MSCFSAPFKAIHTFPTPLLRATVQAAVGAAESTAREFATLSKVHDHNPGHSVAKPFETKQIQLSIWRRFISTETKLNYSSSTPAMCRREALVLHCSGLQPAAAPQYCTSPAVLGELPLLCTFSERAQNTSLWRKSYPLKKKSLLITKITYTKTPNSNNTTQFSSWSHTACTNKHIVYINKLKVPLFHHLLKQTRTHASALIKCIEAGTQQRPS